MALSTTGTYPRTGRGPCRLTTSTRHVRIATSVALAVSSACATAQEIEPRSYSNAPVGVNFLIAGYGYAQGGLSFDPALPVANAHLRTSSGIFGYARSLDFWGKSAKLDVIAPYTVLSGSADYAAQRVERDVTGFNDPRVRLSVDFYGAPALSASEFRDYRQQLIVGGSLQVSPPWGQYDPQRLVNIGTNRWSFKPELGASYALASWTLELAAAATFFTRNDQFNSGSVRTQEPLYSIQTHAIYSFPSGTWLSLDVTYFTGGRSAIDGQPQNDFQQNWRAGATLALPLDARNSIKLYASSGVSARTGNNFDLFGAAWQYRWGGGL